ncbi:MAG: peptidoglycan-binding protein [Oscillospiraceae bacterium]|jgi:hypothetical protein|nr:peptidoglycan-binding protein [Oscillospiraceae bacterium]
MSIGTLRVSVFDVSVGFPVQGARVTINRTGSEDVISINETDSSGISEIVELEAPPVDYSLDSESPKPYSEYDILAEKEGFEPITLRGAQILGDSRAQQNIFLTPANTQAEPQIYSIPEHVLYGNYPEKIAEPEVKELPSPTGFVVLESPVVPEFIVVHDGTPMDSSASNYWIPYKDYIKNVCSSEIYPTWPVECIKANVLAIISFTLNRVYTEWYRSRGYGFTVTSSTAYDQKFTYQRNIFEEISVVVDEIFSSYITRPNIEQPLFTQYCDGKRVTCPNWLSQWGSKDLADNGANYLDILRQYYGYDIYLEIAKEIAGVPVSYPGNTLQIGSTGNPVRTIQSQLNSISNNYPAILKLASDGIYGSATSDAVKTFQSIFNLPQTGVVDYATWYAISKIYVAVEKIS